MANPRLSRTRAERRFFAELPPGRGRREPEHLGLRLQHLGVELEVLVHSDAPSATGTVNRAGLGKA